MKVTQSYFKNFVTDNKHHLIKITQIALASLIFFSFQMPLAWPSAWKITIILGIASVFGSKLSQIDHPQWLVFEHMKPQKISCFFLAFYVNSLIKTLLLSAVHPHDLVQEVTKLIAQKNLKMIMISIILAPFAEEILFRGFLFERFNELLVISRIVPRHLVGSYANIMQSIFFGVLHIVGDQVKGLKNRAIVVLDTFIAGLTFGELKTVQKNLIYSISLHSLYNLRATISYLSN